MDINILRKRFFDTAVADVLRAMDGSSLVGAVTLALCVIDYLAYLSNKGYNDSVRTYLTSRVPGYKPSWMYGLRCGLVHVYGQGKAMKDAKLNGFLLNHLNPAFHLSGNDKVLRLNVENFVTDVVWAAKEFFDSLAVTDKPDRGDKLLIVGISNSEADKLYENMHEALRELDKKNPEYDALYSDIKSILERRNGHV